MTDAVYFSKSPGITTNRAHCYNSVDIAAKVKFNSEIVSSCKGLKQPDLWRDVQHFPGSFQRLVRKCQEVAPASRTEEMDMHEEMDQGPGTYTSPDSAPHNNLCDDLSEGFLLLYSTSENEDTGP